MGSAPRRPLRKTANILMFPASAGRRPRVAGGNIIRSMKYIWGASSTKGDGGRPGTDWQKRNRIAETARK